MSSRKGNLCAKILGDDRTKKTLGINVGNDEESVYDARTPFLTVKPHPVPIQPDGDSIWRLVRL